MLHAIIVNDNSRLGYSHVRFSLVNKRSEVIRTSVNLHYMHLQLFSASLIGLHIIAGLSSTHVRKTTHYCVVTFIPSVGLLSLPLSMQQE